MVGRTKSKTVYQFVDELHLRCFKPLNCSSKSIVKTRFCPLRLLRLVVSEMKLMHTDLNGNANITPSDLLL